MASALSHATVALALGAWFSRAAIPRRVLGLGVACAILPDLDAVGYWLGVPTSALLGHRGLTHSIGFAVVLGLTGTLLIGRSRSGRPRGILALYLILVTVSHGLLDAFTNGGPGIALFSPFSNARYFFPWRPIQVSPISVRGVFNARGLEILASEARWVLLPAAALALVGVLTRRRAAHGPAAD